MTLSDVCMYMHDYNIEHHLREGGLDSQVLIETMGFLWLFCGVWTDKAKLLLVFFMQHGWVCILTSRGSLKMFTMVIWGYEH